MNCAVEDYARAIVRQRICAALNDALDYDTRSDERAIESGRVITTRHRHLFDALAAAIRSDAIWDALSRMRERYTVERDLDVAVELGEHDDE